MSKRYKDRTREEKIANCGRVMYIYVDEVSGKLAYQKEFPCRIVSGDVYCQKCRDKRDKKRYYHIYNRVMGADCGTLFTKTIQGDEDLAYLRRACEYGGYTYLAIPTGVLKERVVVSSGPINGYTPIAKEEAALKLSCYSGVVSDLRISGKLGRDPEKKESESKNVIKITTRKIHTKKEPDYLTMETISAIAITRTVLDNDFEITSENIQSLITRRENVIYGLMKGLGYAPHRGKNRERNIDLEIIKKNWLRLEGGYKIRGNVDLISKYGLEKIEETIGKVEGAISEIIYDDDLGISVTQEEMDRVFN